MAEFNSFPKTIRTDSVSTINDVSHEQISPAGSPRSSSPMLRWPVHYRTSRQSESKSAWDGYASREEFMMMHLR